MIVLGYTAAILMGLSLGMIGGGGSILTVPIMVYFFKIEPVVATVYSLFIVGLTSLVGGVINARKGSVDLMSGALFALPSFLGVYLTRAYLVPSIPDPVLSTSLGVLSKSGFIMIAFASLMVLASLSMIGIKKAPLPGANQSTLRQKFAIATRGLMVGGVTGLVGAGGGFLIIPALVFLVGLPMKTAIGTSLMIIAANSFLGIISDLQGQQSLDWALALSIAGMALLGLFAGMAASRKVSEKSLKMGFGYFVLAMGAFIFIEQLKHLN